MISYWFMENWGEGKYVTALEVQKLAEISFLPFFLSLHP